MKRFNWFPFKKQAFVSAGISPATGLPDLNYGGRLGALLAAALLLGFSLAVGCSTEKSKPTASNQVPAVQTPSGPANSTIASTSAPPPAPAPTPRKVAKKRPASVTYSDELYGVSFLYPRRYTLKTGEKVKQDAAASESMNFVQPGGVSVVAVEAPKAAYLGTDLTSAYFQVNLNKNVTATECEQFAMPEPSLFNLADQPAKIAIGEMELQEVEDIRARQDEQADAKFYHVYKDGACYEFALGMTTAPNKEKNDDSTTPVDRAQVFRGLERILATVKIKSQETLETTASAPEVSTNQGAASK